MKRFYLIGTGVLVAIVLAVLFVPGLAESIEGRFLGWLASNAR
jgi:hypothetical protein